MKVLLNDRHTEELIRMSYQLGRVNGLGLGMIIGAIIVVGLPPIATAVEKIIRKKIKKDESHN